MVKAKQYSSSLIPDNPQACFMIWRVKIEDTDPFRLQANVMKMLDDISDARSELRLKGIRPGPGVLGPTRFPQGQRVRHRHPFGFCLIRGLEGHPG